MKEFRNYKLQITRLSVEPQWRFQTLPRPLPLFLINKLLMHIQIDTARNATVLQANKEVQMPIAVGSIALKVYYCHPPVARYDIWPCLALLSLSMTFGLQ